MRFETDACRPLYWWQAAAEEAAPDMIRGAIEFVGEGLRRILAVVVCLAPSRYWRRFDSLPLTNTALASALCTTFVGILIGVSGYLAYVTGVADVVNRAGLESLASHPQQSLSDAQKSFVTIRLSGGLSVFGFALFTPLGLLSTYLVLTGCLRFTSSVVGDPLGDPLLTGLDALMRRISGASLAAWRRQRRETQEGSEAPDRLVTGAWVGVPSADYVVISSRRKAGWTRGMFVITTDTWYRLGEPFDLKQPEGLRTAYPLTALQTSEILRHGVRYDLPPLEKHGKKSEFSSSASS